MRPIHLFGLLLWRGGLLLVGATILFEGAGWILSALELPVLLEVAFALLMAGTTLVIVSVIMERAQDYRNDGDLRE